LNWSNFAELLAETLILDLPVIGVWVWAMIRARHLGASASWWQKRIGLTIAVLIALEVLLPTVQLMLHFWSVQWFDPLDPLAKRSFLISLLSAAVSFAANIVRAVCWFVVLRAAFTGISTSAKEPEKGLTS
jgi:hypothetical protein